ncbi:hypothetical protein [Nodularia chucula]|uniref:hypothetical protein n=1 Tax=Nodularia chucula TaxID=3093667 RepID=UPI0039C6F7CB
MKPTVFIHTSCHEILAANVALYALKRMSCHADDFETRIIRIESFPHILKYHGSKCIRNGKQAGWYKDVPQSFLPLRFIVPQLMHYIGKAVVIDPDIFAVNDIYDLLTFDMAGKAILARPVLSGEKVISHNSSVMLLDCEKLTHWKWENQIDEVFAKKRDLQDWIGLNTEDPEIVGDLPEEWNHYDTLNSKTKLLHNTTQITQPWKTGLVYRPENLNNTYKGFNLSLGWFKKQIKLFLKGYKKTSFYRQHPDYNQEQLFFALIKECLNNSLIDYNFIEQEIRKCHVRPDMIEKIQQVNLDVDEIKSRLLVTA